MTSANAPYHQLARTDRYKAWKPLAELLTFVGFAFVGMIVALAPFLVLEVEMDGLPGLIAMCLSLAVLTPTAYLAVGLFRPRGSLSSVTMRFRWRWFLRCCAVTFSFFTVVAVIALLVEGKPIAIDAEAFLMFFLPTLVLVPLQAAGEEVAFRGVLLQALGAWFRHPAIAVVTTSIVFAAAHGPETWGLAAVLAASGAMFAILTIRTGGLEAAIAMHAASNILAFTIIALEGKLDTVVSQTNVGIGAVELLVSFVIDVLVFAALLYLGAKRRIEKLSRSIQPA